MCVEQGPSGRFGGCRVDEGGGPARAHGGGVQANVPVALSAHVARVAGSKAVGIRFQDEMRLGQKNGLARRAVAGCGYGPSRET